MSTDDLRPADMLAGDLGEWLCEQVWNKLGTFRFRSGEYRLAEPTDDDDEYAVLLEGPGGVVYDIEIEVMASARAKRPAAADPGAVEVPIDQAVATR